MHDKRYGNNWETMRTIVLERDNFHCRRCGKWGRQVHHVVPIGKTGDNNPANLVTLCHSCHREIDNIYIKLGLTSYMLTWIAENINGLAKKGESPLNSGETPPVGQNLPKPMIKEGKL